MLKIPDVIGFTLAEAEKLLNESGFVVRAIKVTAPPRCRENKVSDEFRIIRLENTKNNEVELLVCNPNI